MPSYARLLAVVERLDLVQAAANKDRSAFHGSNPAGRTRACSRIRHGTAGSPTGYIWLNALPDADATILAGGLVRKGTNGACVRIDTLTDQELEDWLIRAHTHLSAK